MELLKFSTGNAKLGPRLIFSLPAGYSCPHAGICKTMADRTTGEIYDLPQLNGTDWQEYRCFAAMSETRPNVREARWHNWDLIKKTIYNNTDSVTELAILISRSIDANQPKRKDPYDLCRVHESGDFWNEIYFKAWMLAAKMHPDIRFYAFTKSLGMWYQNVNSIPKNFFLTASVGGTLDYLIPKYKRIFKRVAYVVYTEQEAVDLKLEIDHDDEHCFGTKPFALLVHGSQRAGSDAMKAISSRKKAGEWVGYHKETVKAG
jgi:hypothetical protein